jgi:hypothetical protein
MLSEIRGARQIVDEGKRRWFRDDELDLIIWYGKDDSVDGFQLCYDKSTRERALTWHKPGRYEHHAIDSGEDGGMMTKRTPVLIADGLFEPDRVGHMFASRSNSLPDDIVSLVTHAIDAYSTA